MNYRLIAAAVVVSFLMLPAAPCRAQANGAPQAAAASSQEKPPQKILEKNPEFKRLLDPPTEDEFLQEYSAGYRDKAAEIEAKVASISDEKLRAQARSDEWSNVPKKTLNRFKAEADVAYYERKISFLKNHRDAWFEVGLVKYDENVKAILVKTLPGATVEANLRVAMSLEKINQIYEQFRKLAGPEIDDKTRAFISKAGSGSMCASNPEWCYSVKREEMEQSVRSKRMIAVGQGDLESKRFDRLLLVDYVTETVLQELDSHISAADTLVWRYSTEAPPPVPPDPPTPETPPQSAAIAVKDGASASDQHSDVAGNASEPPSPPKTPERPPRTVIPSSVLDQPRPQYPEQARAANVQGEVILRAMIGKEGKVSEVRVLSGDDLLAPSAIEAVRQWRYKPMLVDGVPTETETTITITFSLDE
ncbi:MAG TPA: TonB family protein [Candidatus Acidoferrales bacterium]|nr:TonB family protein [Candidatus Acidoferrales bacterium]